MQKHSALVLCFVLLVSILLSFMPQVHADVTGNYGSFVMPSNGVVTQVNYDVTAQFQFGLGTVKVEFSNDSGGAYDLGSYTYDASSYTEYSGSYSVDSVTVISGHTYYLLAFTQDLVGGSSSVVSAIMSITYTPTGGGGGGGGYAAPYNYTLTGPYYDDGSIANAAVTATLRWINGTTYHITLTSDGNVAGQVTIGSSTPVAEMTWNCSSIQNFTRTYEFPTLASANVSLFITNPDNPSALYSFMVTDFAGMVNPYIKSETSLNGTSNMVIESRSLNASSTVTFIMTMYQPYTLVITCNQGTYTQQFMPENTFSTNIPILAGMFPTSNVTIPTFDAERINATTIGISYIDPSNSTNWLYFTISHPSGTTSITDYTYNQTGSTQTTIWSDADAYTDYTVTATVSINKVLYYWIAEAPYSGASNPFLGIFDFLGKQQNSIPNVASGWTTANGGQMTSAQIAQIIGACIVMLFLCIGSFRSAGACCILSWIIFGVLLYLGWMGVVTPYTIPEFALSGFISLLVAIDESKQTLRYDQ